MLAGRASVDRQSYNGARANPRPKNLMNYAPLRRTTRMAPLRSPKGLSRRVLLKHLTFTGTGVVLLEGCSDKKPAAAAPKDAGAPKAALTSSHQVFTNEEWDTLRAACERIIPKDQDPGALDADVPEYIDRILTTPQLKKMRADFIPGLAALDRRSQRMFKAGFAAAKPEQQDELLKIFKDSPEKSGEARWYELLVVLTLEGFLGDPSYGGNKDHVGWKLVGFKLVGGPALPPPAGYDGRKHLDGFTCKKGC